MKDIDIMGLALNRQQKNAAQYEGRHLLVLAGAGTGKTRTIIGRALYLLDNGVDPKRIKILSFTRKAANEIVERIKAAGVENEMAKQLTGSTFHSWCMEILHRHWRAQPFTCIDEDDRISAFKLAMGKLYNKKKLTLRNHLALKAETISAIYSFCVNTMCELSYAIGKVMDISDEDTIEEIREICEPVIQEYRSYKKQHIYIDYDDMLSVIARALKGSNELRRYVTSQYDYILVDEAQDTNPLQWMLLESFYDNCRLFCVGDDAQSIYGFRGADFASVHSFKERVPQGEELRLDENYRSTQEILNLSNWMLNKSPLHYGKNLVAHRGRGKKPNLHLLNGDWEEANVVTDRILQGIEEGMKYRDFLVMARGFYSLRKIESNCISKGIPYVAYGGTALMRSAHVRDVVSALRVVSNYHDDLAWMRYLQLWPGIGEKKATKIIEDILAKPGLDAAIEHVVALFGEDQPEIGNGLAKVAALTDKPAQAIEFMADYMELRLSQLYPDNWDYRKKDFVALKAVAEKCPTLQAFVEAYILDPSVELTLKDPQKENEDTVILSTIHSAKGLEADVCFVVNVTPDGYPSSKAVTPEEIEEERRCLYVAFTRARDELNIMSRKDSVTGLPEIPVTSPSLAADRGYFLDGLPAEMVNILSGSTGNAQDNPDSTHPNIKRSFDFWDNFDFS